MIHGQRGGVIGAIMTMGVIVGADIPMFLGQNPRSGTTRSE
jgi:PTS system mannitol-specific IIC component